MRTALVTGGSGGIGAATVRAFSNAGYSVAFFYNTRKETSLALALETGAFPLPCDLADPANVRESCAQVLRQWPHIDALALCAGISQQKLFQEITDREWEHMLAVNVSGAFYTARSILPSMIARKTGQIAFLSSMWGQAGASMETHYSASKAALIGLTRSLAREVAPSGVRVNCVAPGAIETPMTTSLDMEALQRLREEIPLGRLGTPEEVAQCVLWLCSTEASYLTGQVISPNGGMVLG
ncbi:MAG: SDR family oxidoreductase [Clostridia bacterium]|nr:SDR family oxidoreductase [Clostridia bacterium]